MGKVSTSMRNALVVLSIASLAVAQQQGVGPASTIQLQPGQFSVFGQPRQQPVNIPGTQGQVVAQFIDETGQAIPIQQLGQPQQQQFQPQQQRFQPAPQQQQQFRPAPQQQFRPAPQQQQQFRPAPVQQQQFRPAPQQQQLAPAAGSFRATANQQDAHQGHLQVHQQNLAIQQQQFSPEQRQALREFQASPPPPRAPQPAAPQPQRFQPAPQPVPSTGRSPEETRGSQGPGSGAQEAGAWECERCPRPAGCCCRGLCSRPIWRRHSVQVPAVPAEKEARGAGCSSPSSLNTLYLTVTYLNIIKLFSKLK